MIFDLGLVLLYEELPWKKKQKKIHNPVNKEAKCAKCYCGVAFIALFWKLKFILVISV